jgi:hypothetical protein
MRYLRPARNTIIPRVSDDLHFAVASTVISGFIIFGRLTDTILL